MEGKQMKRLLKDIKLKLILFRAEIEMRLAIRKIRHIHSKLKEVRSNERENKHFIVLLSLPYQDRKGRIRIKERLHWVDRKNFRKLKSKRWIDRNVMFNDLRAKAFYTSDLNRDYQQEYAAKKKAISRYKTYLNVTFV